MCHIRSRRPRSSGDSWSVTRRCRKWEGRHAYAGIFFVGGAGFRRSVADDRDWRLGWEVARWVMSELRVVRYHGDRRSREVVRCRGGRFVRGHRRWSPREGIEVVVSTRLRRSAVRYVSSVFCFFSRQLLRRQVVEVGREVDRAASAREVEVARIAAEGRVGSRTEETSEGVGDLARAGLGTGARCDAALGAPVGVDRGVGTPFLESSARGVRARRFDEEPARVIALTEI